MRSRRDGPDYYARRAKEAGYQARSVYKLEEINKRWGLLKSGMRVLDLGCAPGSWLQYVAQQVGPQGHVEGIDLKPVTCRLPAHVHVHQGDMYHMQHTNHAYHVVLSDMAPATMGDHRTDAARSANLAAAALDIATTCLLPNGHVVIKVLEGGDVPALFARLRVLFKQAERLRPQATRKESTELFLIGLYKKAIVHAP